VLPEINKDAACSHIGMISPRCCSKVDAATVFLPIAVPYRIGPFSTAEFSRRFPIIQIPIFQVPIIHDLVINARFDALVVAVANAMTVIAMLRAVGRATLILCTITYGFFGIGALFGIIHATYFTGRV